MPVAVSNAKKGDISPAIGVTDPGGCSFDSARREKFNGIRLEAMACL